jgi:hypothetical protein
MWPYMWIERHLKRDTQENLHHLYTVATLTPWLPQFIRWWTFHRAMRLRMLLQPGPSWKDVMEDALNNAHQRSQHSNGVINQAELVALLLRLFTAQQDDSDPL